MSSMVLGGYTFADEPSDMTFIQKDRSAAFQRTYTSIAIFSWGASYVGKVLELSWLGMTTSQYASLLALFIADVPVVFDPQDGSGKTFNVEILSLDGKYFIDLENAAGNHRLDVQMELLIMSEV